MFGINFDILQKWVDLNDVKTKYKISQYHPNRSHGTVNKINEQDITDSESNASCFILKTIHNNDTPKVHLTVSKWKGFN